MDNDKAIAALEEALPYVEAPFDYSYGDPELSQRITGALASLRAVAPAPADQSDAAETGVEEFLFDCSSFPKEIYVRSVMSRHLMTEFRCVAAKLNAEPEVKYLRSDLAPSSDAGRDEVIEACAKIADDFSEEGRFSVPDSWRNDMTPTQVYQTAATDVGAWIAKDIRALASAPSETVGRGELHDVVTHRFAWRSAIVQAFEKAPNDADHEANQLYWKYELSVFDKTFNLLHRLHILPTADRDAIREALKREEQYLIRQCRSEADIMPSDIQGAFHRIRTAALGLLGEG